MKIEFYGKIAGAFDHAPEIDLPEAGMPVSALRNHIANEYAADEIRKGFIRAVVNDAFVGEAHIVRPGDTLAFVSPVSGG